MISELLSIKMMCIIKWKEKENAGIVWFKSKMSGVMAFGSAAVASCFFFPPSTSSWQLRETSKE